MEKTRKDQIFMEHFSLLFSAGAHQDNEKIQKQYWRF